MARLFQIVLAVVLLGTTGLCGAEPALAEPAVSAVQTNKAKPAKLKISGYGFFGNRQLKRILNTLEGGKRKPRFFDPAFVEDAALILASRLRDDGFLTPRIAVRLILESGEAKDMDALGLVENPLPRPLLIREAQFRIRKGEMFYYEQLSFTGLQAVKTKEARSYFVEVGSLFPRKSDRVYTPEKLKRGMANLTSALDRLGYAKAEVTTNQVQIDWENGRVRVGIEVRQGDKFIVHTVRESFFSDQEATAQTNREVTVNKPFSKIWEQDFVQGLRTNEFHQGYPDATVKLQRAGQSASNGITTMEMQAEIRSGPRVTIGNILFTGASKTRLSLLSRRVRVRRGEILDRIKVEEGRYRLVQLGSFDAVDLTYEPPAALTRDIHYSLKEGKTIDVSLLFGYGSYELLRAGVELENYNIWGLAHHTRLKLVQSFKASSADFTYTAPELVGHDVDLFINGNGLRREEVSFTREEYGGGFGGHKYFHEYATDATLRYNYQILNAAQVPGLLGAGGEGSTNTSVGAIIADLKHDRRDNPLYPRRGYKIFGNLEVASDYLGGEANYERFDLAASWHTSLGGGRYLSIGLNHAAVFVSGDAAKNLPFNKRFFPGGENSIRGYSEDEASPRDPVTGKIVGAESFGLASVELEQNLTPKLSLVLFSDSLGLAHRIKNYPFDTELYSVGGGLRYKTLVGPVRLEYGHNLNPRPKDPSGTLQFSIGFPF
jgi:outer membrane protein assembly complex protein YaeT